MFVQGQSLQALGTGVKVTKEPEPAVMLTVWVQQAENTRQHQGGSVAGRRQLLHFLTAVVPGGGQKPPLS